MNEKCRFAPRVAGGETERHGQDDEQVPFSTPRRHNSRMAGRSSTSRCQLPGINISKPIGAADLVRLNCNTHPWMRGWMVVTDDAAAISGADGRFTIDNVPPGTCDCASA